MLRSHGLARLRAFIPRNSLLPSTCSQYSLWLSGAGPAICCPIRTHQLRGKKTKTTVNLADLPQGLVHRSQTEAVQPETVQDEPPYPTVVLQARRNMDKFDNCVLLTRVGGFYELYFEHAEEFGPLLNIKVASKKTNAGPVPMVCGCGTPHGKGFADFCRLDFPSFS